MLCVQTALQLLGVTTVRIKCSEDLAPAVTDARYLTDSSARRFEATVERVRVGREKLVGVPGAFPDAVPTADDPSVDPPAGNWTPDADEPA